MPQYALGAILLVVTNWVIVRIPAIIGDALNVLQAAGPTALAHAQDLAVELGILGATVIVVRSSSRVLFFNPGRDIEHRLGVDLFGHLLGLQRPFFVRHKVGELVSIASNDTMAVRLLIGFAGLQVCNVAVALPMHLWQMARTDLTLTLWCFGPIVFGGIYMRWTIRRFFGLLREGMQFLARLSDRILESYSGIGTIRSHAAEAAAIRRFEERNRAYLALQLRTSAIRAFGMPVLGVSGLVGAGVVLWVGGNRVLSGDIEIGHLATFNALLISLVSTLTSLAWVLAAVSRGIVSLGRVDAILETEPELPDHRDELKLDTPPAVELRNLTFQYPDGDKPALHEISVKLEAGRTLGIFGRTGCGKTTLVNLLARVYTPPPATIFYDGHDCRDIPLHRLRDALAVVPQSPFLFSTTLRDNIVLSDKSPHKGRTEDDQDKSEDDPRLHEVLQSASLWDDVALLPKGLATVVGERGVMLSGGQRQRAALARALYRQKPILLLDDVLSAVDQSTEARLVEAIGRLHSATPGATGPTTVIVSHRTSALEHADEIIVLDEGRIVERGTHEQLIDAGGEYAQTHQHQGGSDEP